MNESLSLRDSTVQEIQFELLRRTSFNALDGERVADSLLQHRDLWLAFLLDRPGLANYAEPSRLLMMGLIKLRDLPSRLAEIAAVMRLSYYRPRPFNTSQII
jgi:hypothetical protein